MIRIADIKRAVADECRVPMRVMSEPDGFGSRIREHSRPRQLAMCLAARLTEHSYKRIGDFFGGRDHSTVFCAMKAVEKRKDARTRNIMRRVTLALTHRNRAFVLISFSSRTGPAGGII
jgi:chromosomal replication initiation ATPase DnaA